MSDQTIPETGITRRGFLKAAGATAGVALAGTSLAFASEGAAGAGADNEQVFQGICRGNCMGGCPMKIYVRDGKVRKVSVSDVPDERYKRICLKGMTHPQRVYSPDRPQYPMRRVEGTPRGGGQWERISWDEAIGDITSKWKELRSQYGPGAISFINQSGSYGVLNGCSPWAAVQRLKNALKAHWVDAGIDMNYYGQSGTMFGNGLTGQANEVADLVNARTILCWGSNLTEAQMQVWHFVAEAIDNGAKLIVIDPNFTTIASKADLFVAPRPGNDGALAYGMCNIMLEKNLVDWDFVKNHSVAPLLVKEDGTYLRLSDLGRAEAESDDDRIMVIDEQTGEAVPADQTQSPVVQGNYQVGSFAVRPAFEILQQRLAEMPPEKAAEISDVPVELMEQVVELYAKNTPASMFWGFGCDRYYNGHVSYHGIGTMAILSGNLCKPGASAGGLCYTTPLDRDACTAPIYMDEVQLAESELPSSFNISMAHFADALAAGEYNGEPFNVKSVFINNSNPLNYLPNRQAVYKDVYDKMELIVVAESRPTTTTAYADIVLPVAHWFEVDDFTAGIAHLQPFAVLQEKAVEPPTECKSDYEVLKMLAEGMGMPGVYGGLNEEEAMRRCLDNEKALSYGLSYDRLKEEKIIRWLPGDNYVQAEGGAFTTATGRAQFYYEKPSPRLDWGQEYDIEFERCPGFIPPEEAWYENPLIEKYPLSCYQEHTRYRVHSNFSEVPWLREFDPEPTTVLSSQDAEERGIVDGDMVRVFNDRGEVTLRAKVSTGIRPGLINIPHGWQQGQFVAGHYQDITNGGTNPYLPNSQFCDTLVQVEKA